MDEQLRAERVAQVLQVRDRSVAGLGITLVSIGPGQAIFEMRVRPDMANGHGICHGGILFFLADTTFAFAANSRNLNTLAQHNSITYLSPAQVGEALRAEATEVSRSGRSSVYDVVVTGEDGRQVALFRGHGRTVKGHIFAEDNM